MARRGMGRKKIEMKKMTNQSNLLVTFSKRRAGSFKKANEHSILCGVQVATIVFSPEKNKVYSFGNPNVEHVIDKFLDPNPASDCGVLPAAQTHVADLNTHLTVLHDVLETQRTYGERLADARKQGQALNWWETPVEDLGLEQLLILKSGFRELQMSVSKRLNNLFMMHPVQNLPSSSAGGLEARDSSGATLGIVMTPQGYALC